MKNEMIHLFKKSGESFASFHVFIIILQLPWVVEEVQVRIKHIWFKVQLPR